MLAKLSLAAGLLLAAAAFLPATAAPQSKLPGLTEGPLVQTVQWGGRCRTWRHRCADRFGWRTREYYRCLRRHDCD